MRVTWNQRGMALPTAMIVMVVLIAMTFAFAALGTSEPVIARNHTMAAQARAHAESGVERAIWAMKNSAPTFTSGVAASPYDGASLLTISAYGGFTLRLADGSSSSEKLVTAVGWAPDNTGQLHGVRKIQVTISQPRFTTLTPPCAMCVLGTLEIAGNATIDARSNHCPGATPSGGTMSTGVTTVSGSPSYVYGPGNNTPNQAADTPSMQPSSAFSGGLLSASEFATLRTLAKAAGTYYQGAKTFNGNLPNGIVFVDTTTGADFTATTPDAEAGSVSVLGTTNWSGWLVVAGTISIRGDANLNGLLYSQNDFAITNDLTTLVGGIITENRKDSIATVIDTLLSGNANITFDCTMIRTAGGTNVFPTGWSVVAGSFREIEGR